MNIENRTKEDRVVVLTQGDSSSTLAHLKKEEDIEHLLGKTGLGPWYCYKTLFGNDSFLFLSSEIHQHLFSPYPDPRNRLNLLLQKKQDLKTALEETLPYFFFSVPDKSVVCQRYLPDHLQSFLPRFRRYVDTILVDGGRLNLSPTFSCWDLRQLTIEECCEDWYYRQDSHCNDRGGLAFAKAILKRIYSEEVSLYSTICDQVDKGIQWRSTSRYGDLRHDINIGPWSDFKYSLVPTILAPEVVDVHEYSSLVSPYLQEQNDQIPPQFAYCHKRQTRYIHNRLPIFADLSGVYPKALFLCDSFTMDCMRHFLCFGFRESLFYWDHGKWNQSLMEWYRPNIIIEIRAERFLVDLPHPL